MDMTDLGIGIVGGGYMGKAHAVAMSAVGLSTKLSSFSELGIKPFYLGFIAAFCVGVISFIGVNLFVI